MLCCGRSSKAKKLAKIRKKEELANRDSAEPPTLPASQKASPKQSVGQLQLQKLLQEARGKIGDKDWTEDGKILTTIFSFLTNNDLLKVRTVNKTWNKHACELLRERMDGVIILQRGLEYYTKIMSKSTEIPIGRIFLNILDMDDPQTEKFFRWIGHSIYYLILNLEGHSVPQFQENMHYLKNLKQISLNLFNEHGKVRKQAKSMVNRRKTGAGLMVPDVHIVVEDYDETTNNKPPDFILNNLKSIIMSSESSWKSDEPVLLEQLIRASPNLKNLNLSKWPFLLREDLLRKAPLSNLNFLTLRYLGDEGLKILAQKRLPLKSADFQLDYDVEMETFDTFLESVSTSLQYLKIESISNKNLVFRLQTKMSRLLIIRLAHWIGGIWMDTVAGNCENLMRLQLSNCDPARITFKYPKANMNVKSLTVNFGNFSTVSAKIRSEVVKQFVSAFPRLESFMMRQVSDKTLGQIVNGWPLLRTLRITSTFGLTDSGLTGIPMNELTKMTKLEYKLSCGCCLPVPVVDSKPCVDTVRQYPHIGKLSHLVDLCIESEEGSHFPLTNFFLHLGVHELTKLETLKIICHNELGPHWCLKCIADTLPNLKELTVMDRAISHDRYEEHEVLYLLKRLPKLKLHFTPLTVDHHGQLAFQF